MATALVRSDLKLPKDASFSELKRSLQADQALRIGVRMRQIGSAIEKNPNGLHPDEARVDEMVFELIGATLSAGSGARFISPDHERNIDRIISIAEAQREHVA